MADTVENLVLDLVEWLANRERTYQETMDVWRTSCPKLPIWEDATERGFVETVSSQGRSLVRLTPAGLAFLKERRPGIFQQLGSREAEVMSVIRRIEAVDVPELFRVRTATDENCLTLADLAALGINEESVKEKLQSSHRGWLCEEQGSVVGFAIGDRSSGEMWVIAVLPSHIRRGIGSALLEEVETWLFSEGCSSLWLTTEVDSRLRAYSFYKGHGWCDWKIENGLRYMKKCT